MFLFKRKSIYYLQYFDESENRTKRISTKQISKPLALKFLSEFKSNLAFRKKVLFRTLKQFSDEYINTFSKTFSYNHLVGVKSTFHNLFKEINPETPLNSLSPQLMERYMVQTFQRTQYCAWLYYRVLKSAFNKAVIWNYLSENPLLKFKLPQTVKKNPSFINESELSLIIENEPDKTLRQIYLMGFYTGMRRNEILNLQWKDVDLKNDLIVVANSNTFTTKSKKDRIVPIITIIKELLLSRYPKLINIGGNSFVFEKLNGIRFNGEFISKRFRNAVNKAKLSKEIHFHSLRHSFASNLVSKGVAIYEVSKLLGHSNISVTEIYSHLKAEDLRNAINHLNN